MLKFVLTDTDGESRIFSAPLSLTIRMDEDVPADDLFAEFAYAPVGELTAVRVYDGDRVIFVGVVDEQVHQLSQRGRLLSISARSLAAHLLDNEAAPQCYDHPSASLIYDQHIRPYGIAWEHEDDATCFGEQQITKGMSRWAVLKNFCNACYSAVPRISADGVLRMKGLGVTGSVTFSDSGDGVVYTRLSESRRRCEEISCIKVKVAEDEGYRYIVENPDAISRGICRERYLNASLASTPMTCADAMLVNADAKSYGVKLSCPGRMTDLMGKSAVVKNKLLGVLDNLYVSGVTYRLTGDGEVTTVQLKRRKNECGFQDM